jgi:hypothetical protein
VPGRAATNFHHQRPSPPPGFMPRDVAFVT